jgi:digeranylgeranylglycerophospholipid reductase
MESYDIVIIGAGPAGLNAALHSLQNSYKPSVLLLDKITPWERPIACAEGVWREPFSKAIQVKPEWIRNFISKAVLHSPDRTSIEYLDKDKGYIINRALMQREMAQTCSMLGASVRLNAKVVTISPESGGTREIECSDGSTFRGKIIIDASGPISCFAKQEKIVFKPIDLEPAYFAVVENAGIDIDSIHVFLGKQLAPGGYAWAFPRGNGLTNVGVVIGRAFLGKINIRKLLIDFLHREFPNAQPVSFFAGSIPCETGESIIAFPGFFKAGDAASTINPISRSGITEALISGGLAGDFALKMLSANSRKESLALCKDYHKAWRKEMGKTHDKLARVKGSLTQVPDRDYNSAFEILKTVPKNRLAMSKVVALSLGRFPRLVWAIRHLM